MVSIIVPRIPQTIHRISLFVNFSLIKMKERIAAKIGPVVKLIQLDIESGIYEMAEYYSDFEKRLKQDLKNTISILFLSYFLRSKSVLRTIFPNR